MPQIYHTIYSLMIFAQQYKRILWKPLTRRENFVRPVTEMLTPNRLTTRSGVTARGRELGGGSAMAKCERLRSSSLRRGSIPCGTRFTKSDTAGEVSLGYAAAPSAISRANGVMRVLARAVSRHHAPSRNTFSPTAARMCPRCTRLRPM